jgi:hypothetical protein
VTVPASTEIFRELRETAEGVSKASSRLYRETIELYGGIDEETGEVIEGVESRYQGAYDEEIIRIEEEALANDRRPPASDIRAARARLAIRKRNPDLYQEWLYRTSTVEALGKWIAARKSVISALQSVLRGERD